MPSVRRPPVLPSRRSSRPAASSRPSAQTPAGPVRPGFRSMSPACRSPLRVWWVLGSLAALTRALQPEQMFRFGEEAGDQRLQPGTDSTAELRLNGSVLFFSRTFDTVYINTNGFLSFVAPPAEAEYLGKMPSGFQMVAPLLGDLDAGAGGGGVYFRQDSSQEALSAAAEHVRRAFPRDQGVEPVFVIIVTWENMAAGGGAAAHDKRNTFQLVVASMESSSCAILLYPEDGLQFLTTPIGGGAKVLEAGFNQGLVRGWWWNTRQGTYFRITTEEETSVRELTEKTTSGRRGVWVYEIGAAPVFTTITPGLVSYLPEEDDPTNAPGTTLPRQPDEQEVVTTHKPQVTTKESQVPTEAPTEDQPTAPEAETVTPRYAEPETDARNSVEPDQLETEHPDPETVSSTSGPPETVQQPPQGPLESTHPISGSSPPGNTIPDTDEPRRPPTDPDHPDRTETSDPVSEPLQPGNAIPETSESRPSPIGRSSPTDPVPEPQGPDPEPVLPGPAYPPPQRPQVVVVDEDLDVDVLAYNLGSCSHNRHKCSAFADCQDHSDGYCCRCRPGFYGDGKDCVPEGQPQRMNGKVKGRVFVGDSPSPVELVNLDLHSYVVANEGRAYVAISSVPDSLGPALQPLSSVGGVMGWAFALEQPGHQNGFRLIGGVFSRRAEVVFHPGNERLSVEQRFEGVDPHDHLVVSTHLEGRVPEVPPRSTVNISPYTEVYQYSRDLITSSSSRDYTVTAPDGAVQTRSYQWRQTITYQSCRHGDAAEAPPTQQLSVDQIFVMFDSNNHLIRYAMSNRVGPVHGSSPEQNPCFTGRHGCDPNAVCRPGDDLQFTCLCSSGFHGDGSYCHDVDECRATPPVCGADAHCSNQPGTYRCVCADGFIAAGDGRSCVDVDECQLGRCPDHASCSNTPGSFACSCPPGYQGDGLQCRPKPSERVESECERHRARAQSSAPGSGTPRPRPPVGQYVPQCDGGGAYRPTQCHASIGQCWCVDGAGREVPHTRTGLDSAPMCIDQAVTPPPVGPRPRPDVGPAPLGGHLLFAQSGRIERVRLDLTGPDWGGAAPLLHVPDRVPIAVAFDCVEQTVYWTDISGPAISRAGLRGGAISPVITTGLQSPEGLALDPVSRLLFWTDSLRDTVEVSRLDGSGRRVLFSTGLVNPRPIATNPPYGQLFWADWNRDGPKIEMSHMDGGGRTVLVGDDLGLPNGLTFDLEGQELCWADAGTRRVECVDPHRRRRRRILEGVQYPFALVSSGRSLYYTDWRRDAVVAVDTEAGVETQEFLPQKRSRLYGIAAATTQCPQAHNFCSNNGGCPHLCLPRPGGFTCRCPDAAADQCQESSL
ncbi:nidogen-1-like [Antennarius striatus]|uniref:nidogen-1-like n=1 Tax=Antennarius striatus TaxID=241820 RepID=UPI0035B0AB65